MVIKPFIYIFLETAACAICILFACGNPKKPTTVYDKIWGHTKRWDISISFCETLNFVKSIQSDSCYWSYIDPHDKIQLSINFECDNFILAEPSMEFCEQNMEYRRVNFPKEYPCGDKIEQKIISVSQMPMILTESYCSSNSDIKYELFTLLDHGQLKIVISFYGAAKSSYDIKKCRNYIEYLYKSIKIQ
jgi:hypothetical protein